MKKKLGNLLLFITSLMCVIVLFGCISINSRAANGVKAPTEVKFEKDHYHFKAVSEGYYVVFITNGNKVINDYRYTEKKYSANTLVNEVPYYSYGGDNLGEITLYVVCSPTSKNYKTLSAYQSDKECKIGKYTKRLS